MTDQTDYLENLGGYVKNMPESNEILFDYKIFPRFSVFLVFFKNLIKIFFFKIQFFQHKNFLSLSIEMKPSLCFDP